MSSFVKSVFGGVLPGILGMGGSPKKPVTMPAPAHQALDPRVTAAAQNSSGRASTILTPGTDYSAQTLG